MPINRLFVTDFRSYSDALIEPGSGFVLLSGDNGAGKTNILEAVSLLTPGRGLRGAPLSEMARIGGAGGFSIAAHLTLPLDGGGQGGGEGGTAAPSADNSPLRNPSPSRGAAIQIGTGTLADAPDRRQVRVNGAAASVNSLSDWLAVLWLTPAMDRLFAGTAGDRRRFLDRLVLALEPSHAHHSSRFEAAMRARNKLLAEDRPDGDWLAALEQAMAEHGAAIADARGRTVDALSGRLDAMPDSDFPRAAIALDGFPDRDFAQDLRANRGRDAAAGRATQGPHRQDLAVTHVAKSMLAARCSTGEQKALLLGLVLAHAEVVADRRGAPPILLLDEVAAHLDHRRRVALFDRLGGRGQVWMTATEAALFEGIGAATRLHIDGGRIRRSSN